MGFRFRKSIKIMPGVRVNLSGRGVSASVGAGGLSYRVGGTTKSSRARAPAIKKPTKAELEIQL